MPIANLDILPQQIFLDGGFGTALIARGLNVASEPTAVWNVTHPKEVEDVHRQFVSAGVTAIQTNTFAASRIALGAYGITDVRGCNLAGVELARAAAGKSAYVIGSVGPTGRPPPSKEAQTLPDLEDVFAEQVGFLVEGGVDLVHFETMAHPTELRAALKGARQVAGDLPVVASFSCRLAVSHYATTLGIPVSEMVAVCLEENVSGVGANCMLTPMEMTGLVSYLVEDTKLPVFAKPTASPYGKTLISAHEFAKGVHALFERGARAVGGCCGTTAEDLALAHSFLASPGPGVPPDH